MSVCVWVSESESESAWERVRVGLCVWVRVIMRVSKSVCVWVRERVCEWEWESESDSAWERVRVGLCVCVNKSYNESE